MKRILIVSLGLGLAALVAAPAFSQTIGAVPGYRPAAAPEFFLPGSAERC